MNNQYTPLVSVTVITYNSAKYVLETLESIRAQTYKNIELIISDDSSTDSTVDICRTWLNENKERFVESHLITSLVNTGIPANKNRAISKCKGEWLKSIAGDDKLLNTCISLNVNATKKSNLLFFFSKFYVLSDDASIKNKIENLYARYYPLFQGNQFDNLMNYGYFFPTVTFFANIKELRKIGLYNENYPYQEDFPMWFKILKRGYSFYFIDSYTVFYRIHGNSTYNNKFIVNKNWHKSNKLFYYKELLPERLLRKQYLKVWDSIIYFLYLDITIFMGNKKGKIDQCCKIILLLSPLYFQNTLKRLFS